MFMGDHEPTHVSAGVVSLVRMEMSFLRRPGQSTKSPGWIRGLPREEVVMAGAKQDPRTRVDRS